MRVEDALYVQWDEIRYLLFVSTFASSGYSILGKARGHGIRTFKDPRAMVRHARQELRYLGALTIHPRSDPQVAALVEYAQALRIQDATDEADGSVPEQSVSEPALSVPAR